MKCIIIDTDTGVRPEKAAGSSRLHFVPVVLILISAQESTAFTLTPAVEKE